MKPRVFVMWGGALSLALLPLSAETPVHTTATLVSPDQVRLSWPSQTGQSYQLLTTPNLAGAWAAYPTAPPVLVAPGDQLSVTVPVAGAVRFFRVIKLDAEPPSVAGMVWIPPGTFTMGSPESEVGRDSNEAPQTQVTISRGFWLGRYEVTQREYQALMGTNPAYFTGNLDRPVERVSWHDAVGYCEQLTARERAAARLPEGYEYRLPTEAQWEYACRAGTTTRYSWGDSDEEAVMKQYCWYERNAASWVWTDPHAVEWGTQSVGMLKPNPWGLYDMHGNVWEWCADWYANSYPGGSVTDPTGPLTGSDRVSRDGGWRSNARHCRSANRRGGYPSYTHIVLGFRVALVPVP